MSPINWDVWRRDYHNMSYAQHVEFYDNVYRAHPEQRHVHTDMVAHFIASRPIWGDRILEIGGWDGELACAMIDRFPTIEAWTNYEICRGAVANSHKRSVYAGLHPNDWVWNIPLSTAGLFIAAHVLEHMKEHEIRLLMDRVSKTHVHACYVECPISKDPPDWRGYNGSHILECGWNGLDEIFRFFGFTPTHQSEAITFYDRQ